MPCKRKVRRCYRDIYTGFVAAVSKDTQGVLISLYSASQKTHYTALNRLNHVYQWGNRIITTNNRTPKIVYRTKETGIMQDYL